MFQILMMLFLIGKIFNTPMEFENILGIAILLVGNL